MTEQISIKVTDIQKKLGKTQALAGVSLYFAAAQMHGVIGPEGAGKTTLLRTILGLLKPDSGTIEFIYDANQNADKKIDITNSELHKNNILSLVEIRNKVAYMPQSQSLYPDLSIDEHLDFFRRLYQINDHDYREKREELLNITRLTPFIHRPAGQLSGGMYKKLGLMCALLRSPEVMLLDEPTNGVDPISRREFWDLLYRLLDQKILIIVTTSYMDEAERCSVVHLIESGKKMAEGEPRQILQQEEVHSFEELFLKHSHKKKPISNLEANLGGNDDN